MPNPTHHQQQQQHQAMTAQPHAASEFPAQPAKDVPTPPNHTNGAKRFGGVKNQILKSLDIFYLVS